MNQLSGTGERNAPRSRTLCSSVARFCILQDTYIRKVTMNEIYPLRYFSAIPPLMNTRKRRNSGVVAEKEGAGILRYKVNLELLLPGR